MPPDNVLPDSRRERAALRAVLRVAFTVDEFCEDNRISRTTLYKLWKQGIGPRFMQVGERKLITAEAAAEWRVQREAASPA